MSLGSASTKVGTTFIYFLIGYSEVSIMYYKELNLLS